MLQIYPFIHAFPKFLAEALIKVEDEASRSFLIDNIRVEKAHAEHWIWMGTGFGLSREDMLDLAEGNRPVLRDVQSLTDWLWYINTKGTLPEAVAATSFAIEGATGDLSRAVLGGFESYRDHPAVRWNPRTYKWMREHARYDDEHPKIAMTIVERYATSEKIQKRVMLAMRRSLHPFYGYDPDVAFSQDTTSYAAFFQDEWSFAEKWKLIGGLRYWRDSREGAYFASAPEVPDLSVPVTIIFNRNEIYPNSTDLTGVTVTPSDADAKQLMEHLIEMQDKLPFRTLKR